MRNRVRFFRVLAFFWFACAGSSLLAEETVSRPGPEDGGPTRVYVAMGLLDIDEIDTAEQNFTANLYLAVRWHDPRLIHDGPGRQVFTLDEVWHPQVLFVNQQKIWPTLPEIVFVSPDGQVEYDQRIWGPFSQPLEVQDFPFDTQDFIIQLASTRYEPPELVFEADPEMESGLAPEFSLPDWKVLNWKLDFTPYRPMSSHRGAASFAMVFRAKRYVSHYLLKIILPLILIVMMSWIVFWIDPAESGTCSR